MPLRLNGRVSLTVEMGGSCDFLFISKVILSYVEFVKQKWNMLVCVFLKHIGGYQQDQRRKEC